MRALTYYATAVYATAAVLGIAAPVLAGEPAPHSTLEDLGQELAAQRQALDARARELAVQRENLAKQEAELDSQRRELESLSRRLGAAMSGAAVEPEVAQDMRAGQVSPQQNANNQASSSSSQSQPSQSSPPPKQAQRPPEQPVGQQPADAEQDRPPEITVIADQGGVLTPKGRLVIDTSLEYSHADRNRVIFRGIEVPPALLIGVFDINESSQDSYTAGITARYGVTNRFDFDVKIPLVYRTDDTEAVPVAAEGDTENPRAVFSSADGSGIGDVQFSARYQLNQSRGRWPFLVGNLSVKTTTGSSPFKVDRDSNGEPTELATGSGFWSVAPSITAMYPTAPGVLFGTLGYTYTIKDDVDELIGESFIESVDPGDSLSMSFGLGISLNERVSTSFGYAHDYVFETETTVGNGDGSSSTINSRELHVGRFLFGVSYRISPSKSWSVNLELGATDDAPDARVTVRMPLSFDL